MAKKLRLFTKPRKLEFEGFPSHAVHVPLGSGKNTQAEGKSSSIDERYDESDAGLVTISSTNATMDNLPGTGRLIDMYIYQYFGRKIERFIGRLSLSSVPSGVLAQRILEMQRTKLLAGADISVPHAFEVVSMVTDGRAVVDGLKCLAKHARSGSLQKRAVALAGLVQISSTCNLYMIFFKDLLEHGLLQDYASLLQDAKLSESEEIPLALLGGLASSSVHRLRDYPSLRFSQWIRMKLISAMIAYQLKRYDPLLLTSLIYHTFSECASCVLDYGLRNRTTTSELEDIIGLTCLSSAFLMRSFNDLCSGSEVDTFRALLVSLHIHLQREATHGISKTYTCSMEVANPKVLCLLFTLNSHLRMLAPGDENYRNFGNDMEMTDSFFQMFLLSVPYRVRLLAIRYYMTHPGTTSYFTMLRVGAIEERALVLPSADDIIEELQESFAEEEERLTEGEDESELEEKLARSLARAQKAIIRDALYTMEFKDAREPNKDDNPQGEWYQKMKWKNYKTRLAVRKAWGEHLRSRYDWDWDVSGCLHNLYKVRRRRKRIRVQHAEKEGRLDVSIQGPETRLPQTIRVAIVSDSGEVSYKMYQECPNSVPPSSQTPGDESSREPGLDPLESESKQHRFRAMCEEADDEDQ